MKNNTKWMFSAKKGYKISAKLLKVLAHPNRLEAIEVLNRNDRLTVTSLAKKLRLREANMSQHLQLLRIVKLVKLEKKGKYVYYSMTAPEEMEVCGYKYKLVTSAKN